MSQEEGHRRERRRRMKEVLDKTICGSNPNDTSLKSNGGDQPVSTATLMNLVPISGGGSGGTGKGVAPTNFLICPGSGLKIERRRRDCGKLDAAKKIREPITEIRVTCVVQKLDAVCLKEQTFTNTFNLQMRWFDDRIYEKLQAQIQQGPLASELDWRKKVKLYGKTAQDERDVVIVSFSYEGRKDVCIELDSFRVPDVYFANLVEEKYNRQKFELLISNYDFGVDQRADEAVGMRTGDDTIEVVMKWECKAVFQEKYELHNFPWDVQDLTMDLRLTHEIPRRWTMRGPKALGEEWQKACEEKMGKLHLTGLTRDGWQIETPNKPVLDFLLAFVSKKQRGPSVTSNLHSLKHQQTDLLKHEPIFCTAEDFDEPDFAKPMTIVQDTTGKTSSIVVTETFVQSSEYKLVDAMKFETDWSHPMEDINRRVYPILRMKMLVYRKLGSWWYNCVLPLMLVTLCTFAAFMIDVEGLIDRCGVTLTVLLTIVAFKVVVSEKLPLTNYPTLIDKYMLNCMAFVVLVVIENAVSKASLIVRQSTFDDEDIVAFKQKEWWTALAAFFLLISVQIGYYVLQARACAKLQQVLASSHTNRSVLICKGSMTAKDLEMHVRSKLTEYIMPSGRQADPDLARYWSCFIERIMRKVHIKIYDKGGKSAEVQEAWESIQKKEARSGMYREYTSDKAFGVVQFPDTEDGRDMAKLLVQTDHMFKVEGTKTSKSADSGCPFDYLSDVLMYLAPKPPKKPPLQKLQKISVSAALKDFQTNYSRRGLVGTFRRYGSDLKERVKESGGHLLSVVSFRTTSKSKLQNDGVA